MVAMLALTCHRMSFHSLAGVSAGEIAHVPRSLPSMSRQSADASRFDRRAAPL